ncbi:MAG: nucleotide exchange factor GrpE [Kiloniellales bacterium]|nr:nucleotide exchange factor GrpE [Kiloniellales bacterium]
MPNAKQENKRDEAAAEEAAEWAEVTEETASEEAASEEAAQAEPVETEEDDAAKAARLEAEVSELRDQLLRALAEAENQRRRSQREREEAVRYAAAPMLRDLLAVADNLQRALESVTGDGTAEGGALKTLLEGVELTQRELETVFERHGIVKLKPLGERLNPHHHEAMFEVPDPEQPTGTIVQVVQPGYLLHDRLLRPARVGVAKGGPPPQPAAEAGAETEAAASDDEDAGG